MIIALISVDKTQALLYNFENPRQLDDFVIDEGEWKIKNGVLEGKVPAKDYLGIRLAYPGSEEWTDYILEVKGTWVEDLGQAGQSAQVEIYFRFVDIQHRYFLDSNYVLKGCGLYAQVVGDWPEFGGPRMPIETLPDEKTHVYKIELDGESIKIYVNDNMIFDAKDNRYPKGTIGLGGYGSLVQFDNLRIEGKGLPQSPVDPEDKLAVSWGLLKMNQ